MADWAAAAEAREAGVVVAWAAVRAAAARAAVEEPVDRRSGTRTPRWKRWGPSADWAVGVRVAVHRARVAKAAAVSLVLVARAAAARDSAAAATAAAEKVAARAVARAAVAMAAARAAAAVVRRVRREAMRE